MIDRTPKEQISDQMTKEIQEARARLVQDRKTGEWYDPSVKFDELLKSTEFMDVMKRLSVR